ncbi:hypothetical protein Cni_G00192 [Canna indica]|uniref:Uncharacterized protein n=1 Tax=Canna indica TaxID=4628 RepID=A0AAQ3JKZ6_9LILI|nr:hypothetical protein Cni_G00192 [Canna indica]
MKDSIRCCIACILPCGALDVIRIVHANGRVEEICGSVTAGEIMQTYPNHVLRSPPSPPPSSKPVVLPPEAELHRGKIYFLVAVATPASEMARSGTSRRRRKKKGGGAAEGIDVDGAETDDKTRLLLNERYLSDIMSEKASTQRDRRRGRVAVWRPHLESISEVSNNDL